MLSSLKRAYRAVAVTPGAVSTAKSNKTIRGVAARRTSPIAGASVLEPLENRQLMSTYYISASGNDSSAGTSAAGAWKSISKVNSVDLNPGDSVLFQGGQTFWGSLKITAKDSGSASAPVTFGSYKGRATISSGKSNGAVVSNAGNIWFENLKFVGSPGGGTQSGIYFQGWSKGVYYSNNRVDNSDISGYFYAGILASGGYLNGGLSNMRLTNNAVHDNVQSGIQTNGAGKTSNLNLYVAYNQVYNNYGDGVSAANGNGIELGGVNVATVEFNAAYLNGSRGGIGGVGIWAYDANQVVFQYNESYNNKTTKGNDGDGFDFDADVSNSIMQYNYAFGNDGTGAQLDQWKNNSSFTNNIVRYNVFQNNGRKNNYGNLEVWGKVLNCYLYNNVIYTTPGNSGSNSGIRIHNSTIGGLFVNGVHFVNNIIDTAGGAPLINITAGEAVVQNLTFTGNVYWTNGGAANIINGKTTLHSLASWQSTGQETWGGRKYGIFADPRFVSSNTGVATPLASLSGLISAAAGYRLQSASPALNSMLSIGSMFGIASGGKDYFGNTIGSNAATIAGADQSRIGLHAALIASAATAAAPTAPTALATVTNVSRLAVHDIGAVSVGVAVTPRQSKGVKTAVFSNVSIT